MKKRNLRTERLKNIIRDAECDRAHFKCLIKCENRSLTVVLGCSGTAVCAASDQVALFWSPGWTEAYKPHRALKSGSQQPTGLSAFLSFPNPVPSTRLPSLCVQEESEMDFKSCSWDFMQGAEEIFGMQAAPRTAAQTWIKFHLHLSLIKGVSF